MKKTDIDTLFNSIGVNPDSYEEPDLPTNEHLWEIVREAKYSGEPCEWKCFKCDQLVTVRSDQTLTDALIECDVKDNCAEGLIDFIMKR